MDIIAESLVVEVCGQSLQNIGEVSFSTFARLDERARGEAQKFSFTANFRTPFVLPSFPHASRSLALYRHVQTCPYQHVAQYILSLLL